MEYGWRGKEELERKRGGGRKKVGDEVGRDLRVVGGGIRVMGGWKRGGGEGGSRRDGGEGETERGGGGGEGGEGGGRRGRGGREQK